MNRRETFRLAAAALCSATALGADGPFQLRIAPALAAPDVSRLAVKAAELAIKGQYAEAGEAARRSGDPAAVKLVELYYLRNHPKDAGYGRIMDFIVHAPNWPLAETLLKRAELAMYANGEPAQIVLGHFGNRKPLTGEGRLALARAHLQTGDKAAARTWVQRVWHDPETPGALELSAAKEFGSLLSASDHRTRLWRLVFAQETNAAIRNAKRLGSDHVAAAKAAQALIRNAGGAEKLYNKLPKAMRQESAMRYALARYYRRLDKFDKARAILTSVPADAGQMIDAEAWWVERRIIARRSIGPKHRSHVKSAYRIARNHGLREGTSAVEAEFLAGWIALRGLKDPATAMTHFTMLGEIAPNRTEKARSHYWLGRTQAVLGNKGKARAHFEAAAAYPTVYYGQLAREEIGRGKVPEEIENGVPSAAARRKVENDEVVRAFQMVRQAGGKSDLTMFLWSFANRFETVEEMNAAATMAWDAGGPTMAVRLAKAAAQRNLDIDYWGYPVRALPDWKEIGKPVERPLVYALSRQESEFNPLAGSKVGAQGLMQLMPGTAKLICKQHGVKYVPSKLTGDPAYNVKLGAAHLGDLIDENAGSYVLTLVAYNAGPRRVREWIAEYGDPRGGSVDAIDWVESIPFQETRNYVQKVLQNLHIYRSRLAPATVRPMSADLKRGASGAVSVASSDDEAPTACGGKSIEALISSCE